MVQNILCIHLGIQNDIIFVCGDIIKLKLFQRANAAGCFSMLVDETTDIWRTEQMSICLRDYDQDDKKIRWDFLTPAVDISGKELAESIIESLKKNSINCQFLVGQGLCNEWLFPWCSRIHKKRLSYGFVCILQH